MHRMATMKRRVIYCSDEVWAMAKRQAEAHDLSVSDWLRSLVTADAFERQESKRRPDVAAALAQTDAVLFGSTLTNPMYNPGGDIIRVPEFRPVPKPGKRK